MRHVVIATHRLLTVGIQFGLQDVAEHLYVVSTSSIALAHDGIHVAALCVYLPVDTYLWEQLMIVVAGLVVEHRTERVGSHLSHHVGSHRHVGGRGIVDGCVHEVVSQADGGGQSISEFQVALMENTKVPLWGVEESWRPHRHVHLHAARSLYRCCRSCLCLCLAHPLGDESLRHGGDHRCVHLALDGIADRTGHPLVEIDRTIGLQPVVGEEGSSCPIPNVTYGLATLEGQLLGDGVLQLLLQNAHIVGGQIVLVHQHTVFEILVAGGGREGEISSLVLDVEARDEGVASVVAGKGGGREFGLACLQVEFAVWETVLIYILIVGEPVDAPSFVPLGFQLQFATCLIIFVGSLASVCVAKESLLSLIESGCGEGDVGAQLLIVSRLYIAVIA